MENRNNPKGKNIFYIGYYNSETNKEERNCILSATNKMDYIIHTLEKNNYEVTVLSMSESLSKYAYPYTCEKLFNNSSLVLLPTIGYGNTITRILQRLLIKCHFIKYILKNFNRDSKVVVYHSLGYMNIIYFLKKLLKFHLILEVEEIYGDVLENSKLREKEIEVSSIADAFIFPTESLNRIANIYNKPYSLVYGTYKIENNINRQRSDNKIHIVYAGTFDRRKGGAIAAVELSKFLDERYHIHIIGFGSNEDVKVIKDMVESISKNVKSKITYDGLKKGVEYINFIQSCDIGLSTQNPDAAFNDSSFPSKILSYMSNGLRVVSIRIPVVEHSQIGKYLYYYDEQTPKNIADVIKKINFNDGYDGREIISDLDIKFQKDIAKLLV